MGGNRQGKDKLCTGPNVLLTQIFPRWSSRRLFTIASPSPAPRASTGAESLWWNFSNTSVICCGGMPHPVSATEISTTLASDSLVEISTRPPAGVNLMALWIKLVST